MVKTGIAIGGGGVIGLTLALEMRRRGADVTVVDDARAGRASLAAAGMLAAQDPANDAALAELSAMSVRLYPALLKQIGVAVETTHTLQADEDSVAEQIEGQSLLPLLAPARYRFLKEESLDPRKLHAALLLACKASGVAFLHETITGVKESASAVKLDTQTGTVEASQFADCTGSYSALSGVAMQPVKGQMLRVRLAGKPLFAEGLGNIVIRTEDIYIVPRLDGTALIGATVEHEAGFNLATDEASLHALQHRAAELLPVIATAEHVEWWAGLRPRHKDGDLPVIGSISPRRMVANGHFRNGILLAPATAVVMADLMEQKVPAVEVTAFQPPASIFAQA